MESSIEQQALLKTLLWILEGCIKYNFDASNIESLPK